MNFLIFISGIFDGGRLKKGQSIYYSLEEQNYIFIRYFSLSKEEAELL